MATSKIPIESPTAVQTTNIGKLVWARCGKVVTISVSGASPIELTQVTTNPPPMPVAATGIECELFYGDQWVGYLEFNSTLQRWRIYIRAGYGYGTITYICG